MTALLRTAKGFTAEEMGTRSSGTEDQAEIIPRVDVTDFENADEDANGWESRSNI